MSNITVNESIVDPGSTYARSTSESWIVHFFDDIDDTALSTRQVYRTCITGWYKYLIAEGIAVINIEEVTKLVEPYLRERGQHVPRAASHLHVSQLVNYAMKLADIDFSNKRQHLVLLRPLLSLWPIRASRF